MHFKQNYILSNIKILFIRFKQKLLFGTEIITQFIVQYSIEDFISFGNSKQTFLFDTN
jgi:hypothetical protein